jgi:hypothetical protein
VGPRRPSLPISGRISWSNSFETNIDEEKYIQVNVVYLLFSIHARCEAWDSPVRRYQDLPRWHFWRLYLTIMTRGITRCKGKIAISSNRIERHTGWQFLRL